MRRSIAIVIAGLVCAEQSLAQTFGPWHVLGRFEFEFDQADPRAPTPVERQLENMLPGQSGPNLDESYKGADGEVVRWSTLALDSAQSVLDVGAIDLHKHCPAPESERSRVDNAACYLYRRIDAPSAMELAVNLGSDDGVRLWLNGELLVEAHVARVLVVRDHYVVLRLQPGANHLFAKVTNKGGGFFFQIAPWSKVPQSAINAAIDRGVDFIVQSQMIDGTWGFHDDFGGGHAAFAAYTLLKCGVRRDHPAVRMAFAVTDNEAMDTTYATAALILALEATGDASVHERIHELCRQLVDWQDSNGLYGYPIYPGDHDERPVDLSCTLFAALALRAASHTGFVVPDAFWKDMVTGTLRCLEREREVELVGFGKRAVAGFSYRIGENATGSMTTAGLSIHAIAEELTAGRLPPALRTRMASTRELALNWIAERMMWSCNPPVEHSHHYYWVYGLERVGVLLGLERIGNVDWYADGAAYLIQAQNADGSWNPAGYVDHQYMDTLLALLFLKRATMRATGESSPRTAIETREADADVRLRATGDSPLTVWVFDVRAGTADKRADAKDAALDIEKIEYFARMAGEEGQPALLATIAGDKAKVSELARFALRHQFDRRGAWRVSAKVWVRAPAGAEVPSRALESPELEVHIDGLLDATRLEYTLDASRNLLLGAGARVTASSSRGEKHAPGNVIDGSFATRWTCAADEEYSWIRITLDRSLKADRVLFSHALPRLVHAATARATRIEVVINGKDHHEVELAPDVVTKTALDLAQVTAIKQLEVRVIAARDRKLGTDGVGFSEIELQRKR